MQDLNVADHPYALDTQDAGDEPHYEADWKFGDVYPPELYTLAHTLHRGNEYVDSHGKIRVHPGWSRELVLRRVVRLRKQCERIYSYTDYDGTAATSRCTGRATYRAYTADAPVDEENWVLCAPCLADPENANDLGRADYITYLDTGARIA